ncbi:MAG: DUF2357 domain-containing protein [Ruminococcaceae bacterium]|nr:DUF2357 domain-containing protein [Oscillospiraceae bacterium]
MNQDFETFYDIYKDYFISLMKNEDFYQHFINMAQGGKSEVSFMHRFVNKQIDVAWVEAIEECIIPLDTIIRNPRRFIAQEEEIIPIELARKITTDSIKHLAQHTNMIAKVEDGNVTPNRILNIFKEESFETYENRFIYTLLLNIQYFIDKRLGAMKSGATGENVSSICFKDEFSNGKEKVRYSFELSTVSPAFKMNLSDIHMDTSKMDLFERVERIRKILFDFQNSALMKSLSGCALVRPPIMRTNVLQKDPNFKKAKELWDFIDTYRGAGFNIEVTERDEIPDQGYIDDIYDIMAVNYALLKHHTGDDSMDDYTGKKRVISPKLMERTFREMLDNVTLDVDVVKTIFINEYNRAEKRLKSKEKKLVSAIDFAISTETKRRGKVVAAREAAKAEAKRLEMLRIAEERAAAEKLRLEEKERKAQERAARAEEKARLEKEKEKQKKQQQRERELLKKRLEREKQKEKERKQKERDKKKAQEQKALMLEKDRKEKERAKAKALKEKQLAAEKAQKEKDAAKAKALREREAAKLLKEREAAKAKALKKKEAEAEKLRKEKELQLERDRKAKERAKAKALKEKELEKEKLRRQKVAEAEKARRQKATEAEKARRLKAKEAEKLRMKKQKEREQEKAKKTKKD